MLIQALLSLAALLMAIDYCRTLPRSPWINWRKLWNGGDEQPGTVVEVVKTFRAFDDALIALDRKVA